MAKKYIIAPSNRQGTSSEFVKATADTEQRTYSSKNLARFSKLDIDWDVNAIKNSLTSSLSDNTGDAYTSQIPEEYANYSTFTGNNEYIAFFDKSYRQRRDFLKMFAADALIEQCIETIADESIVFDTNGYFATLDTNQLQSKLKDSEETREILNGLQRAYKHVYYKFGFLNSITAWEYMIKLLVEGLLAFEIVFEYDDKKNKATSISAFKELDPLTLKPGVQETSLGLIKYWTQSTQNNTTGTGSLYGTLSDQIEGVKIQDAHLIYISWASKTNQSKISYVERLVRSFNLLRQLENSRIIWNIQNAQQKVKIQVPVGEQNEERIKTRLGMFRAMYKEDVTINSMSGEVIYNGTANFPFAKNIIVPSNSQGSVDISEIQAGGYDLNSTEQLVYFWDRFIAETKIPRNRFSNTISKNHQSTGIVVDESTANHEEYAFSRFLNRIRSIYKEILLKPTWIQFGLMYPQYANMSTLKNYIGLMFNEENIFTMYKERKNLNEGVNAISNLMGLRDADGTSYFSPRFLISKYLGMTEDDIKMNTKYKASDTQKAANAQQDQQYQDQGMGGGFDMGGFGGPDLGGGMDLGGGPDLGGGMDLGGADGAESDTPPEPAE